MEAVLEEARYFGLETRETLYATAGPQATQIMLLLVVATVVTVLVLAATYWWLLLLLQ